MLPIPRTLIDSGSFVRRGKTNALNDCILLSRDRYVLKAEVALLQRLFSMFPNGWPGAALLLLRLVAGTMLTTDGVIALRASPGLQIAVTQSMAIGAGVLLALGLWTPVAGVLVALIELRYAFLGTAQIRTDILLGVIGLALAALGPGVRSIDALLYGRRRFEIRDK
jgi:putative oxidoreductase